MQLPRIAAERTFFPYDELRVRTAPRPQVKQILANLEFFVNLLDAITCPTAVGRRPARDYHPYATSMPFERIPPIKSIHVYPDIQTMDKSDFAVHTKAWFDRVSTLTQELAVRIHAASTFVLTNPLPGKEAEFNYWYNVHIPDGLGWGIFDRVYRYKAIEDRPERFLAIWESDYTDLTTCGGPIERRKS